MEPSGTRTLEGLAAESREWAAAQAKAKAASVSDLLLQNQLQNCRRAHRESLGALGADINRLARRAYCSEDNSFIRHIMLDVF
ncbi:UNVERIFIED_CONTAM: hypothetical protein FKN15_055888 [Acipenser sinensis]